MNRRVNLCLSLYRRLAAAYPHEFRMLYGEDLDRMGEDAVPEIARRCGLAGVLRLLFDVAVRLPVEHLAEIRRDMVYSARGLARSPGFTAVAVLSIGIGIGMCSVILCGSNSMVGPLPGARDPGALISPRRAVSYPAFEHYRDQRKVTASATAFLTNVPFSVAFSADRTAHAERFNGQVVSPEYFATLGVTPEAGRLFSPATEKPGMAPVVVVSHQFWRTWLASDPYAIGRTLRLNGQTAIIVGITAKAFQGVWPFSPTDLFVPATVGAAVVPELTGDSLHDRSREMFQIMIRPAAGLSVPAMEGALDALTFALDRQAPDAERDRDRESRRLHLIPSGTRMLVPPEQRTFVYTFNMILWAIVLSLLCANLANLLLARGAGRRREIAVRLSLGAGRLRLIRQLVTESVLVSLSGGVIGIGTAYWITHIMSGFPQSAAVRSGPDLEPDLRIFVLTLMIAGISGIAFGLVPALVASRTELSAVLKEGAQTPLRGYRRFGLRNLFMGYQVASSLALLLVTAYLVIGYRHIMVADPGFETANLNLTFLDPVRDGYSRERIQTLFENLPQELARLGGVRGSAVTLEAPFVALSGRWENTRVSVPAADGTGQPVEGELLRDRIGADYFSVLGVPLVAGREFTARDTAAEPVPGRSVPAVVNQTAARTFFGNGNPIGRLIRSGEDVYTVVGMARDTRSDFVPTKPLPTLYVPLTAGWLTADHSPRMTLLVRGTAGSPTLPRLVSALAARHPDLTVFRPRTMQENLASFGAFLEWSSSIYAVLGLFAVLLACIGLGGVTAYAVAQRRKEIGIRMALGAGTGQIRRLVLREGVVLTAAGCVVGFAGAWAIARATASLHADIANAMGTRADNPLLVFGAPALLAVVALLACDLPAHRASRIDPVAVLREQ